MLCTPWCIFNEFVCKWISSPTPFVTTRLAILSFDALSNHTDVFFGMFLTTILESFLLYMNQPSLICLSIFFITNSNAQGFIENYICEWYMARFVAKNYKNMCYDDIGFCGQDVLIFLDSVDTTIGRAYLITWREKKILCLLHLNSHYKTWNGNLYDTQLVKMWHKGIRNSTHNRATFLPKHMHLQSIEEITLLLHYKSMMCSIMKTIVNKQVTSLSGMGGGVGSTKPQTFTLPYKNKHTTTSKLPWNPQPACEGESGTQEDLVGMELCRTFGGPLYPCTCKG